MKIFAKFKKLPAILAVCLLLVSALGLAGCSNTKSGSTGTNGGTTGTPTSYGSGTYGNGGGSGTYTGNGSGTTGSYGTSNTGSYTGGGAQNRYTNGYGTTGANSLTTDLNDVGRDISNGVNSMKKNLSADM